MPTLTYLEIDIVRHCNLNCRGCTHFAPLQQPWYMELSQFEKDMAKLKELFSNIGTIRIMGGEPLLHPQWKEFLIVAKKYFPHAFVALVTNGILVDEVIKEQLFFVNSGIHVMMSDYGLETRKKAQKCGFIMLEERSEMFNLSLSHDNNYIESWKKCPCHSSSYYLKDGRIYICAPAALIDYFNEYFNRDYSCNLDDRSIDIYNHTGVEILTFLKNPVKVCGFCDIEARSKSYQPFAQSQKDPKEWER